MLKIIDNKRIDLTDDEFEMYENICKSYKQGKDLFKDLFETDESGIIIFLKPPKKIFSLEVVIFLQNIMVQQHLRRVYSEVKEFIDASKKEIAKLSSQTTLER